MPYSILNIIIQLKVSLFLLLIVTILFSSVSCSKDTPLIEEKTPVLSIQDSLILVDMFHEMGGPGWRYYDKWDLKRPVSEWKGVTLKLVDNSIRVSELWFYGINEIIGTLTPKIGDLSELESLSLAGKQLTGPIPETIGKLKKLKNFRLYYTGLSSIPQTIGDLQNLETLDFDENPNLEGGIPTEIVKLNKLKILYIRHSENLGGIIPTEIGRLKNLNILYLFNLGLIGELPQSLGQLENIHEMNFLNNSLSGSIPIELANLRNSFVSLSYNKLSGEIPTEFGESSVILSATNNNLIGEIPLGILNRYTEIDLKRKICPQNIGFGFINCTSSN